MSLWKQLNPIILKKLLTSSMSVATSPSTSIGALGIECFFSSIETPERSIIFFVFDTLTKSFSNDISETKMQVFEYHFLKHILRYISSSDNLMIKTHQQNLLFPWKNLGYITKIWKLFSKFVSRSSFHSMRLRCIMFDISIRTMFHLCTFH